MRRNKATNLHPSQRIVEAISGTYDPPGDPPLMTRIPLLPHQNVFANMPIYPNLPVVTYATKHTEYIFDNQDMVDNPEIWNKRETPPPAAFREAKIGYDGVGGSHVRLHMEGEDLYFHNYILQSTMPVGTLDEETETWATAIVAMEGKVQMDFGLFTPDFVGPAMCASYNEDTGKYEIFGQLQYGGAIHKIEGTKVLEVAPGTVVGLGIHYTPGVIRYHVIVGGRQEYYDVMVLSDEQEAILKDIDVHVSISTSIGDGSVKCYGIRVVDDSETGDPRFEI